MTAASEPKKTAKPKSEGTTLYSPDGQEYVAGSPTEVTRLLSYGYKRTKK